MAGVAGVTIGPRAASSLTAMPLFEYSCRECGHRFETLVMGSRQPVCPACRSGSLEKLYSTFGTRSTGSSGGAATPGFT
jgi:putative FmdB family regulatory protein